jgi:hypothetical protein
VIVLIVAPPWASSPGAAGSTTTGPDTGCAMRRWWFVENMDTEGRCSDFTADVNPTQRGAGTPLRAVVACQDAHSITDRSPRGPVYPGVVGKQHHGPPVSRTPSPDSRTPRCPHAPVGLTFPTPTSSMAHCTRLISAPPTAAHKNPQRIRHAHVYAPDSFKWSPVAITAET